MPVQAHIPVQGIAVQHILFFHIPRPCPIWGMKWGLAHILAKQSTVLGWQRHLYQ
jgi:hypothetical protein